MDIETKKTTRITFTYESKKACKIALIQADMSQATFCNLLGIPGGPFSDMLAGRRPLTQEVIAGLREYLPAFAAEHLPAEVA